MRNRLAVHEDLYWVLMTTRERHINELLTNVKNRKAPQQAF